MTSTAGRGPQQTKPAPWCCAAPKASARYLRFVHPLARHQFVKGTVEAGETHAAAALRELYEEAGITAHSHYDHDGFIKRDPIR